MPSTHTMQKAVSDRDKNYDGRFFYGVITTGIFCTPSCPSRAASPENIRFFHTSEAALDAGFRPCKRCQPTKTGNTDPKLLRIARYIDAHADQRLTLKTLALQAGLSPSRLQRAFKQVFGVSPKAYQDALRAQHFKTSLKEKGSITDAIFKSGYGSVSRVYGMKNNPLGMSPKAYRRGGAGEQISYACRTTALGPLMMAATDVGVCFVQFAEDEAALIAMLQTEFPKAELLRVQELHSAALNHWIDALNRHISQGAPRPDLPLDLRGTAFQISVWRFLLSVREGEQLSYSELAMQIEKPKAVRAVASACASNRIGVLVPCHRVLRADGKLGGYRWGLARKQALLDAERKRREAKNGPTDPR